MFRTLLVALALTVTTTSACAVPPAPMDQVANGIRRVDVETFRKERDAKAFAVVVDVRTPEEYAGGHVPGAVNIPLDQLESRLAELAPHKDAKVALICQSGRRSMAAATTLSARGFTGATNVEGGTSAWISAGQPVDK